MTKQTFIEIIEAPHRRSVAEREMRYEVRLKGQIVGELYFNTRGYVGTLPTPEGKNLQIPEGSITSFRREAAKLNREFAAANQVISRPAP